MKTSSVFLLVLAALGAIVVVNSSFVVREVEQAMVLTLGKVDRTIAEPGLHFKVPFYQQVLYFDKRILETDSSPEEVQTRDKKRVVVDSFTRWRIVDAKKFYEAVRTEQQARQRINIIVNSNIRRAVALVDLSELISGQRSVTMEDILNSSSKEAEPLGVEVVDVRIKRADLPEQNSNAIYYRMRAEREKEAKEIRATGAEEAQKIRAEAEKQRTVLLAEARRDSEKLRGEGDAKAIKIFASAFNKDKDFYAFTRSLEAYKNSLKDEETLMLLDPSMDFFRHFEESTTPR